MGFSDDLLDHEMDLHREFAAEYGISREELEATRKAPTCQAYTDFLVRTAHEGSVAEVSAALYPCGQGFLDVGEHAADLATEEHRYSPWTETYTSDEFREHDAMREAFLTSARLELRFWEMAYTREEWEG